MLCEVVDVWCGVWAAQCAVCDRNARHGMSWRGGNGFGDVLRQMEIYFAQYYGFLGYFECVFAMLSSNVGKSFVREFCCCWLRVLTVHRLLKMPV